MKYLPLLLFISCSIITVSQDECTEIMLYIHNNIQPKKDIVDEWQLPDETIEKGTGDCEDMAILMLSMVAEEYGRFGEIVLIKLEGEHACCLIDGVCYDPAFGIIRDNYIEEKRYTYEQAMYRASK